MASAQLPRYPLPIIKCPNTRCPVHTYIPATRVRGMVTQSNTQYFIYSTINALCRSQSLPRLWLKAVTIRAGTNLATLISSTNYMNTIHFIHQNWFGLIWYAAKLNWCGLNWFTLHAYSLQSRTSHNIFHWVYEYSHCTSATLPNAAFTIATRQLLTTSGAALLIAIHSMVTSQLQPNQASLLNSYSSTAAHTFAAFSISTT